MKKSRFSYGMLYFMAVLILAMYIYQMTVILVPFIQTLIEYLPMGAITNQDVVRIILLELVPNTIIPITIPGLGFFSMFMIVAGFIRRCNRLIDESKVLNPDFQQTPSRVVSKQKLVKKQAVSQAPDSSIFEAAKAEAEVSQPVAVEEPKKDQPEKPVKETKAKPKKPAAKKAAKPKTEKPKVEEKALEPQAQSDVKAEDVQQETKE